MKNNFEKKITKKDIEKRNHEHIQAILKAQQDLGAGIELRQYDTKSKTPRTPNLSELDGTFED